MPTTSGLAPVRRWHDAGAPPTAQERAAIERRMATPGSVEEALEATSALLSDLSGAAGMVMVPEREPRLSQMNLIALGSDRLLAVLVGEDGQVENRVIEVPTRCPPRDLEQAGNYITAQLAGRTLAEAVGGYRARGAQRAHRARRGEPRSGRTRAGGVERGHGATSAADRARRSQSAGRRRRWAISNGCGRCWTIWKANIRSRSLLESAQGARATRIFIGSENRLFALSGSSVIASPYRDADRAGDRRSGGDRPHAVELRAGRAHGGFHRAVAGPIAERTIRITETPPT